MNAVKSLLSGILLLISLSIFSQGSVYYKSKIADLGDIKLQYMDFGGEGPALIWMQDFHNYFDGRYRDTTYYPIFKELAKDFRVLAPIRRGYGESTDTGWGYDVATQSTDLLRLMDALGIEKAVMYGRSAASQDMTWIAEHHPERVSGLIYDGNPIVLAGCYERAVLEFVENWSVLAPDFEKKKQKLVMLSRLYWRPHFLNDPEYRIDIPALRFIDPKYNWPNPNLGLIETGLLNKWIPESTPDRKEEIAYLEELVKDTLRLKELHQTVKRCDKSAAIENGMRRAFGNNLQTVHVSEMDIYEDSLQDYLKWRIEYMRSFIKKIRD
ncbi:alpha/beta fold hydrolase [Gramella sp. KN1008]|uniref:alpha/beta fold hydrolase n=1 Tax=Gramella sp. KN1008 TaxID=2529298 RepID=UPI0010401BF3|nr:alpha/beta hydrolase [Gramella sp. KN1008]TBW30016.1 alpha/beta hydrolase [Gramella sp. KN1008]